jgi:hypothetical protein
MHGMLFLKRVVSTLSIIILATFAHPVFAAASVCDSISGDKAPCSACMDSGKAVWTAIGCIPATPDAFVQQFITIGAGLAGGIALLLIIFGGLQMMTSAGNPEKLNEAKELVSAAITGLLLIIFSIFILRVIGYDILRIPGFGTS